MKVSTVLVFMLLFQAASAQYNFSNVDAWMKDNLKDLGGRAVLMIEKNDSIIYDHTENHLTTKEKMIGRYVAKKGGEEFDESNFTDSSRERIASSSKWLSAALLMTFVDEGKLDLEDSIGKYLPVMTQYGKGAIKVRYCLSHLTGIQEPTLMDGIKQMQSFHTMDDAMLGIAQEPMEGTPGKTFHYGNAGLQICAAIVEKIGQKDFDALFAERIAASLEMKNTDFGKNGLAFAAGGAWSTAKDYMNFLEMILDKGVFHGRRVLSERSIDEMQKDRTADADIKYSPAENRPTHYGYGEWVDGTENGVTTVVSSPGLFGSVPLVDNKRGYCGFLMVLNIDFKGRQARNDDLRKRMNSALGF